jgi:hypothetical protein
MLPLALWLVNSQSDDPPLSHHKQQDIVAAWLPQKLIRPNANNDVAKRRTIRFPFVMFTSIAHCKKQTLALRQLLRWTMTLGLEKECEVLHLGRNVAVETMEKNGHVLSFRSCNLAGGFAAPCAVAQASAFGRGKAGAKRTDQKRGRKPERELSGCLSGRIDIALGLRHHFVDARLSASAWPKPVRAATTLET